MNNQEIEKAVEAETAETAQETTSDRVIKEIAKGDFLSARNLIENNINQTEADDSAKLQEIKDSFKVDSAARLVAIICSTILLLIAILTLFH
jgi:hypothetical protein